MLDRSMRRIAKISVLLVVVCCCSPPRSMAEGVNDPFERVNRGVFWFNDTLDHYLIEPAAKGWRFILPDRIMFMAADAYDNALFPVYFVNNLLQAKPRGAAVSLGRFLVNTTVGVGGLFDVATDAGVPTARENFSQTLGTWGVGHGPYLVLPLLGPSSARGVGGQLVDGPLRIWPFYLDFWQSTVIYAGERLNWRALHIDEIAMAKGSSLDYYAAVRNAYFQNADALIEDSEGKDGAASEEREEDLYFFDVDEAE